MPSESPIEKMFREALEEKIPNGWSFRQEFEMGFYRVDFIIECGRSMLIVECDGHEWHDRTKEQAKNDRNRDRFFLWMGVPVVRFTGSELFADPVYCAKEAISILKSMVERSWTSVDSSDRLAEEH